MVVEFGNYQLDDEPTHVDRDAVWSFLSSQAYWARWRTRQDVERQLDSAWRVVGVYDVASDGRMVGFARAISDGVAFAYLADTYIVDADRGQGLGKELVRVMIDCGPGVSFRWTLPYLPMPTASMHNSGSFDQMTRTLSESLATAPSAEKVTIQWPRLRSTGPPSDMTLLAPLLLGTGRHRAVKINAQWGGSGREWQDLAVRPPVIAVCVLAVGDMENSPPSRPRTVITAMAAVQQSPRRVLGPPTAAPRCSAGAPNAPGRWSAQSAR